MQDFSALMVKAAQFVGSIVFNQSVMKLILMIFMVTASSSRAGNLANEASISATCDNSTMHLRVNFTRVFRGSVYQSRNYFDPNCSYTVPLGANVTEMELSIKFVNCDVRIGEQENGTIAWTQMVIQMHNLLDTVYDRVYNVSCEIENYHSANESEDYNPFSGQGLEHSWIEFKNGLVLLGEVGEPAESQLFLVVNVRDYGSNEDMIVQNCIAHTDRNVTRNTRLVQLSNFYGCPDPSAILPNFTVIRPRNKHVSMLAYAPITNFNVLVSRGRMSISCGITICENACPAHCNDTASPVQLPLSDYATKNLVSRNNGGAMPTSLRELNRHNDRTQRSKRSLGSYFSSILRWESRVVVNGSVSEGNVTNLTSTGVSKGLILKSVYLAKDVLVPATKSANINLTNIDSNLLYEGFYIDWPTFRFIALITICLFITVVACYCCYSDDKRKTTKGQHPFIF